MLYSVVNTGVLNIDLNQSGSGPVGVTKNVVEGVTTVLSTVPINTNAELRVNWNDPNIIIFDVHQDVAGTGSSAISTLYMTQIQPLQRMDYQITGNLLLDIQGDAHEDGNVGVNEVLTISHETIMTAPGSFDAQSSIVFSAATIPEPCSITLMAIALVTGFLFSRFLYRYKS